MEIELTLLMSSLLLEVIAVILLGIMASRRSREREERQDVKEDLNKIKEQIESE